MAAPVRVLMLGDSITQGGDGRASYRQPFITPMNGSYPGKFEMVGSMTTTLGGNPPSSVFSGHPNHEGHYGWRADQILNGLPGWLSGYTPDVVLLHVGTNDAIQDVDNPSAEFLNETWNDIAGIISALRGDNASVRIFLAAPVPIGSSNSAFWNAAAGNVSALGGKISSEAAGAGVSLVTFSSFDPATMHDDDDPVHPNATGESYMASTWFSAVQPSLNQLLSPVITSSGTASGTVGAGFAYTITASESPASFGATGLPSGLSLNSSSGVISGTPTAAGIYGLNVSATNNYGTGQSSVVFTIGKGSGSVSLSGLSHTYDGNGKSATISTSPSGLSVSVTYGGSSTAPSNAGTHAVVATITDPNYSGSASGTLAISQATQIINFAGPGNRTFGEAPFTLSASSSSALAVSFSIASGPATVSGSTLTMTSAGNVTVRASQAGNGNYTAAPAVERSFTVFPGAVTVTLSGLSTVYNGSPRPVSVNTTPAGLAVAVSYDGGASVPVNAGNYAVVATVADSNYSGAATGTLAIAKASQTLSFTALPDKTYGDAPFAISATASSGLPVALSVVSGPAAIAGDTLTILGAGSVTVRAAQSGTANVSPAPPVERAFTVAKAAAGVSFADLSHAYDGTSKQVSVTTTPSNLAVTVLYDGGTTAPSSAGTYAVTAQVNNDNYAGTGGATMVIAKAAAAVVLHGLFHKYDGTPKTVSATTSPAGIAHVVTYDGSETAPSAKGSYAVSASITDPNYSGAASATLYIGDGAQLVNLSSRALVGASGDIMIPGFVVRGTGTKTLLIRGIGPALAQFGLAEDVVLQNPTLRLLSGNTVVASNTVWSTAPNAAEIITRSAEIGAFALAPNSGDCALLLGVAAGPYTVQLSGLNNTTGLGLVEIYDLDETGAGARLVNISTRSQVGTGGNILIPGYVIDGVVPRTLLIRAVGPTLGSAPYNVPGVLADPVLSVFKENEQVASNDNWESNANVAEIQATTAAIGAFALPDASKDAAVLITLNPGAYTVQVSGIDSTTGVSLVEIYEIP